MDDAEKEIEKLMADADWGDLFGNEGWDALNKNVKAMEIMEDLNEALRFVKEANEMVESFRADTFLGKLLNGFPERRQRLGKALLNRNRAAENAQNLILHMDDLIKDYHGLKDERFRDEK